jgi:hypothetical protein
VVDEGCGGPMCGDGTCSIGEGCRTCPVDCGLCPLFDISSMDAAGTASARPTTPTCAPSRIRKRSTTPPATRTAVIYAATAETVCSATLRTGVQEGRPTRFPCQSQQRALGAEMISPAGGTDQDESVAAPARATRRC